MTDLIPDALMPDAWGALPARDPFQRPWPGREITSGGVTLHVRETPGPDDVPAVYVHGLAGSATNWTDLAALLSPLAAGIALDLPGFGRSRPLAVPDWSPAGHADALLCFLAGLGKRVHLVANSMGAMAAISVAARRPELVASLALVSPAMPDRRPDPRRISDPRQFIASVPGRFGERARAEIRALTSRDRAEAILALCFGDPSIAPEHRIAELAEEFEERRTQRWAYEAEHDSAKKMIASWVLGPSLWTVAARVRVPALVVWGDRDRLVAPRLAARTAAVMRARLLMLEGVGHVAMMEAPEAVASAVADMWRATAAGTWEDPTPTGR